MSEPKSEQPASEQQKSEVINFYDTHPINEEAILAKLESEGRSLDSLNQLDLKNLDQDHYGGTSVLDQLADLAQIDNTHHVLDVCSGMGGPARWLAYHRQCNVTGLDFTLSRVEAATRLTDRVNLAHRVNFVHGDATAMPLDDSQYDVLISQESWLHIPAKTSLVSECVRVVKPAGTIAFTDVVALGDLDKSSEELLASQMHTANIASAKKYIQMLEEQGCTISIQHDLSEFWTGVLLERLAMYRSMRESTIAKFGEARYLEYDNAYSHFVGCFENGKLGGVRIVAQKVA